MPPRSSLRPPAVSALSPRALGGRAVSEETQVNSDLSPSDFNVVGLECDVSSERSVQKAFAETIDRFGRVDSVVASAGTCTFLAPRSPTQNNFHRLFFSCPASPRRYRGELFRLRVSRRCQLPRPTLEFHMM